MTYRRWQVDRIRRGMGRLASANAPLFLRLLQHDRRVTIRLVGVARFIILFFAALHRPV